VDLVKLEELIKYDYYSHLYPEIDIRSFLQKPIVKVSADSRRKSAAPLTLPPIGGVDEPGAGMGGTAPTNIPGEITPPPPDAAGGVGNVGVGGMSAPTGVPMSKDNTLSDKDKEKIQRTISDIENYINNIKQTVKSELLKDEILAEIDVKYEKLKKEIESFKERRIPQRSYFDTEGAYRHRLFDIAVRVLDEVLPQLFDAVPEYDFISSQVSRTFEDGTVADALVTIQATVVRDGMKYQFFVEVPVLNGLMMYPLYVKRGQRVIPLTKEEIQKELASMSYRRMDIDTPYEKENLFSNIGENIHRKPDTQKWYKVRPNVYKPVSVPKQHLYKTDKRL